MLPLLFEIFRLGEERWHCLQRPAFLLLHFLVVFRLQNGVVLLWVFERVADQFYPQCLDLDLFYFLFLQRQPHRDNESMRKPSDILINLDDILADLDLFLQGLVELQHVEVGHEHEVVSRGFFQRLDDEVVHDGEVVEEVGGQFVEKD